MSTGVGQTPAPHAPRSDNATDPSDPHWRRHLEQIAPMTAGLAVQTTKDLGSLPIGPGAAGLGVLGAWTGGALLLGGLVLRLRDA
jgi:ABC-2 type transport system permease protein